MTMTTTTMTTDKQEINPFFPIYTDLRKKIKIGKDLTQKNKKLLVENIALLNQEGHELIYAIIKYYYLIEEKKPLPFFIDEHTTEFCFDLEIFPVVLKRMIEAGTNLHLQTQK